MIHRATDLIVKTFDEHEVKYRVTEVGGASMVEAGFEVEAGPEVVVRYISNDEDNDVAVRIFGLMHRIPQAKRVAVMEACNTLSAKIRFFKFYLDSSSNVNVEADLPVRTDDDCLGECCFELFVRIMSILENEYHILAMNYATKEELDTIAKYAFAVNDILTEYLKEVNIELVDFKLEFGRLSDGTIVLADEISPDTCRFWDSVTNEKLDKDRFRRDMGGVEDAYQEVMKRLLGE